MKPTIKDVAKEVGCSITAVSHVLNGKGDRFSPKLRSEIFRVAMQLEYRPNQIAVSLATKKSKSIGLVLPNFSNMFFALLAEEIEKHCRKIEYNVILCNSLDDKKTEHAYIETLLDRNVEGIILALARTSSANLAMEYIKIAKKANASVCLVDRTLESSVLDMVTIDHHLGGSLACSHLLENGHKRIAFLTGPKNIPNSQNRLRGARDALERYKVEQKDDLVFCGDYSWESGYKMAESIMKKRPDAIFAFNDWSALGLIMRLKELGYSIPNDISLVGYDDLPFANEGALSLTTVRQPIDILATSTVDTLISRTQNTDSKPVVTMIKPQLVVRNSSRNINENR